MSLAIVHSRACTGIQAPAVTVEAHISNGLPNLSIVGLPETAVKESKDRVRSALLNSHFDFPARRITINLAPADLPKEGGRFDLPIALGILAASGQIPLQALANVECAGELALSGELRPIQGIFPLSLATRAAHRQLIIPAQNAPEAALLQDLEVLPAQHLLEVCAHLQGKKCLSPFIVRPVSSCKPPLYDLRDVKGQYHARRALEIAAAGRHSLLMIGPPGTGKTMLAMRLPGILPDMTEIEAMESAAIASISEAGFQIPAWRKRPFRTPHHTASAAAIIGGGNPIRPGEISLAHQGVLFLDELPEFNRRVLESLREPLTTGHIAISRAALQAEFPAKFQLVAAMNPCPCGYWGDESGRCHCSAEKVQRYRSRISGPLLDRIDLHVSVPRLPVTTLTATTPTQASQAVAAHVLQAWQRQQSRAGKFNADLNSNEITRYCQLSKQDMKFIENAIDRLSLSARAYHRLLCLARSIADLDASAVISRQHLSEAFHYRCLDRPLNS